MPFKLTTSRSAGTALNLDLEAETCLYLLGANDSDRDAIEAQRSVREGDSN